MLLLALFLILVGGFGFLGCTFGSIGLARILSRSPSALPEASFTFESGPSGYPFQIDILLAAHNEEALLRDTLSSVWRNICEVIAQNPLTYPKFQIRLGLDHCTDRSEAIAREWASKRSMGLEMTIEENQTSKGKWNTLQHLVKQSCADWVILVDSGSVWQPGLLNAALPHLLQRRTVGLAPSYQPVNPSRLEQLNWNLETTLKSLESKLGGPVSVHGATVMYRRNPLLKAYQELTTLRPGTWLNDDVVIPLMMRMQNPNHRIHYLTSPDHEPWVIDYGIRTDQGSERVRRKRLLKGNLEWIQTLYRKALRSDLGVGLIASRRVLRVFWAYWVLSLSLGIVFGAIAVMRPSPLVIGLGLTTVASLLLLPVHAGTRRLQSAFSIGLEVPFHWINSSKTTEKIWN